MKKMVEQDMCVVVSDETLTDARRVRDLLGGVTALLTRDVDAPTVDAARATAFEAKATIDVLIYRLEGFFAQQRTLEVDTHAQAAENISMTGVR